MLEERTKIYGMMVSICEEAVELKRDMLVLCAHHHYADSFDGPRAYQMVINHLTTDISESRSKPDEDFYEAAYQAQRKSTLQDGCAAAAYSKKAYAWVVHILPHLPTIFKDKFTTAQHLIDMMPNDLRSDGRDLERELRLEIGRLDLE